MADITIAFDPGSSLGKVYYTLSEFKPGLLLMEPEVAKVSKQRLTNLGQFSHAEPQNSAWVEYQGDCRAVGFLARQMSFHTDLRLSEPKFVQSLYKVLAIIGILAQSKNLPNGSTVRLGLLLPWSEYEHRALFERSLLGAIQDFTFRGQQFSFELESLDCKPEGFGLFFRGRKSGFSLKQRQVCVIMIGFRNISILLMDRGGLTKGITNDLGFIKIVQAVKPFLPGQLDQDIAAAIYEAGPKVTLKPLKGLVSIQDKGLKQQTLNQVQQAALDARSEYWSAMEDLLQREIPSSVEEVIFAGGTAFYFQRELNSLFSKAETSWCEQIITDIEKHHGDWVKQNAFSIRLADPKAFFYILYGAKVPVNA